MHRPAGIRVEAAEQVDPLGFAINLGNDHPDNASCSGARGRCRAPDFASALATITVMTVQQPAGSHRHAATANRLEVMAGVGVPFSVASASATPVDAVSLDPAANEGSAFRWVWAYVDRQDDAIGHHTGRGHRPLT